MERHTFYFYAQEGSIFSMLSKKRFTFENSNLQESTGKLLIMTNFDENLLYIVNINGEIVHIGLQFTIS